MKLAHISDIHLYAFELSKAEFFSKSLFTNINHLFHRQFIHSNKPIMRLVTDLKRLATTHLLVSGDLTTTASKKEFLLVKALFSYIQEQGIQIFALAGNHDVNDKQLFRLLNPTLSQSTSPCILDEKILHCPLSSKYHLILIDSTKYNYGLDAEGHFSKAMQIKLDKCLKGISPDCSIIVANHFPIHAYKNHKNLIGRNLLLETLEKYDNVALYLHGHRHQFQVQKQEFTIVDAGSASKNKEASACFFHLEKDHIQITPLLYNSQQWHLDDEKKELLFV